MNIIHKSMSKAIFKGLWLVFFMLFMPTASIAHEQIIFSGRDTGLGLGIGYALVRFDTSFKYSNKQTGQFIFVDAEGTLDLPDNDAIPVLYGSYRFSQNHAIGFTYFKVSRESSLINFDKTLEGVRIIGNATFNDDTQFFNFFYGNTLHEDDHRPHPGAIWAHSAGYTLRIQCGRHYNL